MNNFKFQVEERRRQVASFIAQSMTELEIADKLGVNQSTISRDVQALKEMSQSFIYDLAKSDLAYYYKQCIDGIEGAQKHAWKLLCIRSLEEKLIQIESRQASR